MSEAEEALEAALAAHFEGRDVGQEYRPAEVEAFRAGWWAAVYAAFPQRFILGADAVADVDVEKLAEEWRTRAQPILVAPSPGVSPDQLAAGDVGPYWQPGILDEPVRPDVERLYWQNGRGTVRVWRPRQ